MLPVSMLTATNSPHGVGPHSRCLSGSPEAAKTGERSGIDVTSVGLFNQAHRLEDVVRIGHKEMKPGIVRRSPEVDAAGWSRRRNAVSLEGDWHVRAAQLEVVP